MVTDTTNTRITTATASASPQTTNGTIVPRHPPANDPTCRVKSGKKILDNPVGEETISTIPEHQEVVIMTELTIAVEHNCPRMELTFKDGNTFVVERGVKCEFTPSLSNKNAGVHFLADGIQLSEKKFIFAPGKNRKEIWVTVWTSGTSRPILDAPEGEAKMLPGR